MLLSAVSVLVVAQSSSEIPKGLMNNPVFEQTDCFYDHSLYTTIQNLFQDGNSTFSDINNAKVKVM